MFVLFQQKDVTVVKFKYSGKHLLWHTCKSKSVYHDHKGLTSYWLFLILCFHFLCIFVLLIFTLISQKICDCPLNTLNKGWIKWWTAAVSEEEVIFNYLAVKKKKEELSKRKPQHT